MHQNDRTQPSDCSGQGHSKKLDFVAEAYLRANRDVVYSIQIIKSTQILLSESRKEREIRFFSMFENEGHLTTECLSDCTV